MDKKATYVKAVIQPERKTKMGLRDDAAETPVTYGPNPKAREIETIVDLELEPLLFAMKRFQNDTFQALRENNEKKFNKAKSELINWFKEYRINIF